MARISISFRNFGFFVGAGLLAIHSPASRADESEGFWKGGACAPVVESLCRDFTFSQSEVLKCLEAHVGALTSACRKDMVAVELDAEGIPETCRTDAREYCSNVEPGQHRVFNCIKRHRLKLAPSCRVALEELKKQEVEREKALKKAAQQQP